MQNQDWRLDLADLRERVETVPHQRGSGHKGIMILGDLGHAGEGRFEDQSGDVMPRREDHGYARPERLAIEHQPSGRDPLEAEEIERGGTIGTEAVLGRSTWGSAISAILHHDGAIALPGEVSQAVGAIADLTAIAVKVRDDWAAAARRRVP